jgi:hypothetical protein
MADKRRYSVITVRRINAATFYLTINGELWAEVEWSDKRRAWCIQDAEGRCLTHVESIVGADADMQKAIRIAKRMIVNGEMPSPEEALRLRREREDGKRLGVPIIGDITAGPEAVLATVTTTVTK